MKIDLEYPTVKLSSSEITLDLDETTNLAEILNYYLASTYQTDLMPRERRLRPLAIELRAYLTNSKAS